MVAGVWDSSRRDEVERAFARTARPQSARAFANVAARSTSGPAPGCTRARTPARPRACAASSRRSCSTCAWPASTRASPKSARSSISSRTPTAPWSIAPPAPRARSIRRRAARPTRSCTAATSCPQGAAARARAAALDAQIATAKADEYAGHYSDGARLAADVAAAAEREHFDTRAAEARYWSGVFGYHLGKLDDATRDCARAGADALALGREELAVRAYAFVGYLEGSQQRHYEAAHLALDVAQAALRASAIRPSSRRSACASSPRCLTNEGRTADSIDAYQRALAVQRKAPAIGKFVEAELDLGPGARVRRSGPPDGGARLDLARLRALHRSSSAPTTR